MIRLTLLGIFFSVIITESNLEKEVLKYSFNDSFEKTSSFSIGLSLSNENLLNYSISFSPSNNLIISGNFINKSLNESLSDNYFFNNFGINLNTKNNINYGVKINTLKHHKFYNTVKWNEYYLNKDFDINSSSNIQIGISFLYSNQISYSTMNLKIEKKIFENIFFIAGYKNISFKNNFNFNLGLQYSL
tara:strand:- start:1396 stop:1962 length:567 start_codon:yes stop_codon:yes gene_type:complete